MLLIKTKNGNIQKIPKKQHFEQIARFKFYN